MTEPESGLSSHQPTSEPTPQTMTEPTPQHARQLVCETCGRTPVDESSARLTWALGVENGRQVWTCDLCSRENLRSIEGKLDSAWW